MLTLLKELTETRTRLITRMREEGWTTDSIRELSDLQGAIAAIQAELSDSNFGQ